MRRASWMLWTVSRVEFTSASGQKVPVELRRRKGTRHLRLSVNLRNEIVVSLPWHCSERACLKFIDQHRAWLDRQIESVPGVCDVGEWLQQNPWLTAGGQRLAVDLRSTVAGRPCYRIYEALGQVVLRLPDGSDASVLDALVRKFAREVLIKRVGQLAAHLGLDYTGLSVRNQSSRWGSCSSKRGISLNWRLVLLEPGLQDYIILHELAHLSEMNHSKRFWSLLDQYDPERRKHEAELESIAPTILRVGVV